MKQVKFLLVLWMILVVLLSGWVKYFENGGKNVSFKIEDDEVYMKYISVWNEIKELLAGVKFHSEPIYDESYIKIKLLGK